MSGPATIFIGNRRETLIGVIYGGDTPGQPNAYTQITPIYDDNLNWIMRIVGYRKWSAMLDT